MEETSESAVDALETAEDLRAVAEANLNRAQQAEMAVVVRGGGMVTN